MALPNSPEVREPSCASALDLSRKAKQWSCAFFMIFYVDNDILLVFLFVYVNYHA